MSESNRTLFEVAFMSHPRRWWILVVLCLSLLTLVVDNTVLNLAIPSLMRDLGASPSDVQWIIDAYILVFAGLLLTSGSLSDRYGRRLFLVIGLAFFGGASVLAMLATQPWQLIGARALMGVGGSLVMPSTMSIMITVFDDSERRKAFAAWSSVAMVGVIAGPTLGGFLLQHYYWGSVFLLNVPIAVVAIVAAFVLMPESKGEFRPVDPVGVVLSVIGMGALVYAVVSAPAGDWNPVVVGVAVLALLGFVLWERRVAHAMLPLSLFRDRQFSGASFSIVLLSFGSGALMLALTQYLQFVLGYEPLKAGLALLPYVAAAMVFNGVGAGLGKKLDNRTLIVAGLLVMAGGFGLLSTLDRGYGVLIASLLIMGVGGGLAGPAAYASLMGAVPPERAGVGSALNDTVQQVGAALSVAVLGSVLAGVYTASMPGSAPEAARDSISGALALGDPSVAEAGREAFVSAMSVGSLVGLGFSVGAAVVALLVLRRVPVSRAQPAQEEPASV
ncbi:MFS transporter [Planotetraspora thailandica]|uniref:MFS transporter n=1 Tax=Planotetraspora thailandica TaxID=487172 RepID=A0A8J3V451_9ACTN|nr:MFS transporter [Planotetraspora thailandica]GII55212.1 MFS transporter [Planotetraspora thailandica]